tara:strand:- start:6680 stop:6931 length:252 start_codon:yes stop_codon:yes gene_type:complete
MKIRFLVKNITEKENKMEELWIFINEEYVPVSLMISEETVDINGVQFHAVEFNSGYLKYVSTKGVKAMRKASERVQALIASQA